MRRIRVLKVVFITATWVALSLVQIVYDDLLYRSFRASVPEYALGRSLVLNPLAALVGGILSVSLVIFVLKERLRRRPFAVVVAAHTVTYVGLTTLMTWFGNLAFYSVFLGRAPWDPATLDLAWAWFTGPWTLKTLLFWTMVAALTSFLVEVFDIVGPGLWKDFVLGRYHRPKLERRAFMFLDLRGSTTIAERLGSARYYELLNDYYRDISDAIVDSGGDIYQYVGDEVIVTWPAPPESDSTACLECFFGIRAAITRLGDRYRERFGLVPDFKASFHVGDVTTGEIGLLKREIVFTGDVLNVAARIQERCNPLNADALASGDLVDQVRTSTGFNFESVEQLRLRGREAPTTIFAVRLEPA